MSKHQPETSQSKHRAKRITARELSVMKQQGEKISVVTCYDAAFAKLVSESPIDVVLVGDSMGNVVLGYKDTISVTMEHMVHHTAAVSRGLNGPLLVADMPFMSYNESVSQAVRNAARLMQEGGAQAVKLEGGFEVLPQVKALTAAGIPVMGHLGLTPQKIHSLGGFKVQGRGAEGEALKEAAVALQEAGVFSLVLELVPKQLSQQVTKALSVPTIGIGAGVDCDGQVLVLHDLLGFDSGFTPKFLKRYAQLDEVICDALRNYSEEVKAGHYPGDEHSFN